jgi:RNA polymerase sigma-70 factor, ECF subfamily
MDDDELIAGVAAGDDTALRELFSRHAPWLAARLRVVLPAADVENALQETFLAAWRGAASYRPEGAAGGWLWGTARRQAARLPRRRGPAALVLPAVVAADRRQVGDQAEAALSRAELEDAVAALGPPGGPEREVWRLMYVEDRPVAEVAELMGVPEGTVKSRAHRALRLLRAALRGGPAAQGGSRCATRPQASRARTRRCQGAGTRCRPMWTWAGCGSGWPRGCGAASRGGWSAWPGGCCARRAWPGRC